MRCYLDRRCLRCKELDQKIREELGTNDFIDEVVHGGDDTQRLVPSRCCVSLPHMRSASLEVPHVALAPNVDVGMIGTNALGLHAPPSPGARALSGDCQRGRADLAPGLWFLKPAIQLLQLRRRASPAPRESYRACHAAPRSGEGHRRLGHRGRLHRRLFVASSIDSAARRAAWRRLSFHAPSSSPSISHLPCRMKAVRRRGEGCGAGWQTRAATGWRTRAATVAQCWSNCSDRLAVDGSQSHGVFYSISANQNSTSAPPNAVEAPRPISGAVCFNE